MATPVNRTSTLEALAPRQLPLWKPETQPQRPTPAPAAAASQSDWPEREKLWAAWEELVPTVSAREVRDAVSADMAALTPTVTAATAEPAARTAAVPPAANAAAAVSTALTGADDHAERLKGLPEWQRLQTVRGALHHLWDVMKEKAGPAWDNLRADIRFQGFWKTASIRACEAISSCATALAARLAGDLPTADALLKLSDSAIVYSTAAATEPTAPPAGQQLANSTTPKAYATREDAVRAAEEVTAHFQAWISSPMGQELAASKHPRVTAFRDAWQQLPPHDTGPAAAPYGDVAQRARAMVTAAAASTRFTAADVQSLHLLAQTADTHSARLALTLPPATPKPTAAAMPRIATSAPPTARTPRTSL